MDNYNETCVKIVSQSSQGIKVCATAGRISTTEGTGFFIFDKSVDAEVDLKLINKVLNSGHKTVLEHYSFSVIFNNVTRIFEQFLIDFRLASYTIKSGRYTDFSTMGFYLPMLKDKTLQNKFKSVASNLVEQYTKLLAQGQAKEDARFILPHSVKSNIICSCNARELLHMICTMIYGRGQVYQEILQLGNQLKQQFEQIFPGLIEREESKYKKYLPFQNINFSCPPSPLKFVESQVEFLGNTEQIQEIIEQSLEILDIEEFNPRNLSLDGKTARILEQLNFTFKIKNLSLACLPHIVRHRMQNIIVPNLYQLVGKNYYKIPPKIQEDTEALAQFKSVVEKAHNTIVELQNSNEVSAPELAYLLSSSRVTDLVFTMNGRELLWFFRLRTCERAQWEIRDIANKMLEMLRERFPYIFKFYGPSCTIEGYCPEGKLTCGHPKIN